MPLDTGDVNDQSIPTKRQLDYESSFYDNNTDVHGQYPNDYWKYMGMAALGGKPMTDFRRTRPESWQEETMRKLGNAFSKQEDQERIRQMHSQSNETLEALKPELTKFVEGKVMGEDGMLRTPKFYEHPSFGTFYRARHILGHADYDRPHNDMNPNLVQGLISELPDLDESPFEKGKKASPGDKFKLLHMLMSGRSDEETAPLRGKYLRNNDIKALVDTMGYNEKQHKYFLKDPGADPYKIDKSQFKSKRFPYKIAGKFMNALGSVTNDEMPVPLYKQVGVADDERTKATKNAFNNHLRNISTFSRPAIATGRVLGSIASSMVKPIAPVLGPALGALASVAVPTLVGHLMHRHAEKKTEQEMRHKRFGPNPYDIINRGH
jgi:hypothetical protein